LRLPQLLFEIAPLRDVVQHDNVAGEPPALRTHGRHADVVDAIAALPGKAQILPPLTLLAPFDAGDQIGDWMAGDIGALPAEDALRPPVHVDDGRSPIQDDQAVADHGDARVA